MAPHITGALGLREFVCLFVCLFHGVPVVCGGRRLTKDGTYAFADNMDGTSDAELAENRSKLPTDPDFYVARAHNIEHWLPGASVLISN